MTLWARLPGAVDSGYPTGIDGGVSDTATAGHRWMTGGWPVDDKMAPGLGQRRVHPQSTTPITVTVRIQFFKEQGALCEVPL